MNNFKILAFAGSLRKDSINKKLAKWSGNELKLLGFDITFIDLADYPLPVYNQDITAEKFSQNAIILQQLMCDHHAWLIASPEYNYSITGCLKNLIDWISRAPENNHNMAVFSDKIVALVAASPSTFGGTRSIRHLREVLSSVGCLVIPNQATIVNSFSAFDAQDNLIDETNKKAVHEVLKQLTAIASKLV